MTELKPCPFCGGEAELWHNKTWDYVVRCTNKGCAARTRQYHENSNGAVDAWNTRAEHHVYEQRITGSGSDWGEIMCDAFDSLLASACDACTFDELERFRAYIIKEVGE